MKCVLKGNIRVSLCRCCVLVSLVQPVIVLSAWFCMVCSLLMLVSDAIGDKIVFAYSMILLYVVVSVSLALPQCVDVSDLKLSLIHI